MRKEICERDEIDELIEKDKRIKSRRILTPEDLIPLSIPFTEGAYKKADMIGPTIRDMTGEDLEWSAFLLAKKGDPKYIVRDLLIQEGQKIEGAHVGISGENIVKASNQVSKRNRREGSDFYVIGWIHGHGTFQLIPSSRDKRNFDMVINSVSLNTEQKMNSPLNLIETDIVRNLTNGKLVYSGEALEDAVIEHILPKGQKLEEILSQHGIQLDPRENPLDLVRSILESIQTTHYQSNIFGFAYFVIMNNLHHKPYAAIGLKNEKAITRNSNTHLIEGLDIEKVVAECDIEVDEDELKREIKEKVDYQWDKPSLIWSFFKRLAPQPATYEGGMYIPRERGVYIPGSSFGGIQERIKTYKEAGDIQRARDLKKFIDILKNVDYTTSPEDIASSVDNFLTSVYRTSNMQNNQGGKNA